MIFTIIPLKGTDKIKLNLTSQEIKELFPKQYIRTFKKARKTTTDKFSFGNVFYDENGKSEAIEFYEPTQVVFENNQLMNQDYSEVEQLLKKLDSNLIYEEGVGFISIKYQIGIYAPFRKVEAVLVGREGYYSY